MAGNVSGNPNLCRNCDDLAEDMAAAGPAKEQVADAGRTPAPPPAGSMTHPKGSRAKIKDEPSPES